MKNPPITEYPLSEIFLPAAAGLALEAGRRVMELSAQPLVTRHKADHSPVTNADHAANDILRTGLRATFPDHRVLSEETGFEGPAGAPFVWLIDPLDGTRAYAKGRAGFSVMLGLLHEGHPVLGVVYDPKADDLFEAVQGAGAFWTRAGERRPARMSGRAGAARAVIVSTGFPDGMKAALSSRLPGPWLPPVNSVGVKVGVMARGLADVYVNHHPVHLWDTAGPQVILEEAGGAFALWDGKPLAYDLDGSLAHPGPTVAAHGRDLAAAVEDLRVLRR